jgi:cytochrome P450
VAEIYYDPYDYEIDRDPHPVWKRMRDEAPLYYNEKFDFYALSRYQDVLEASKDWQTFSSAHGSVLELLDAPIDTVDQMRSILFEDPPVHDLHRGILGRVFTPRRVRVLEERAEQLCGQFLDPFVGGPGFDFVVDYGAQLPMMMISTLLGVPQADQEMVRSLADQILHREEGDTGFDLDVLLRMAGYLMEVAEQRRSDPKDDVITMLVEAEFTDESGTLRKLTDQELMNYIMVLASAGNETVARLIGWLGDTLARHPDQRHLVANDLSLIPGAIEETLRYEAPSPVQARLVMRDVELHGQVVPKDSKLLLLTGSAGRDERAFDQPNTFDIRRRVDHHVTFGHGVHFCLGAALARLEGRVALAEVLKRFPDWEIDDANAEMVHTSTVRGWAKLPVRVAAPSLAQ